MTRKLSEIFNMPEMEKVTTFSGITPDVLENGKQAITNLEKIDEALTKVNNLEMIDSELDELSTMAISGYKDLCDLAQNVDSRYSGELFSAAGTMFGHALEAKKAKITKSLKMIELQLKKAAIDQKVTTKNPDANNENIGTGRVLDRNELLKIVNGKDNDES